MMTHSLFPPDQLGLHWATAHRKAVRLGEQLGRLREEDLTIGTAAKQAIYHEDTLTLYRYTPQVAEPLSPPLLIVYALVNRPYMVDLQPDRSLVRNLLALGVDIYLVDWGYPGPTERWLTLDDYINGYIGNCVEAICHERGVDQINLLGICQGGAFSLCYAALHPERVKNLITMVTPVDFHVPATASCGLLNTWCQAMDAERVVATLGNVPGLMMNFGYLLLRPFALTLGKYADLLDMADDDRKVLNFLRMEKWIFDSPDQAGEAWQQFIQWFYQQNGLVRGSVQLGDQRVDLRKLTMPVLNVYAEQDHLVPPASSLALGTQIGSEDYTVHSFPVGHVGMYVSNKVQQTLPSLINEWLRARA